MTAPLGGPFAPDIPTSSRLVLVLPHVAVAAVLIPLPTAIGPDRGLSSPVAGMRRRSAASPLVPSRLGSEDDFRR